MTFDPLAGYTGVRPLATDPKPMKKARGEAAAAIFDDFRAMLEARLPAPTSPWRPNPEGPRYEPDFGVLPSLLALPIRQGAESNTGRLGKVVDAWVAHELRRSGFRPNEVWPRLQNPRIWPLEYARLLDGANAAERVVLERRIAKTGRSQAEVLGQHYFKQVDVLISQWDRGPELMVSTKAQMSSFGNNLNNRFEEFVGDAHNLRGRFPLASIGIVYLVRSTVEAQGDALRRVVDMLRKLRGPGMYDSTCLIAVEYEDAVSGSWPDPLVVKGTWPPDAPVIDMEGWFYPPMWLSLFMDVHLRHDLVPADLSPSMALPFLVRTVLDRTPVTEHPGPRDLVDSAIVAAGPP